MRKAWIFIATFAVAFALGAGYTYMASNRAPDPISVKDNESVVTYSCEGGKSIWAAYGDGSVSLSLSDGSDVTLPHATSASGARYASNDGSYVFWSKDGTAFIEEDGEGTYVGCEER